MSKFSTFDIIVQFKADCDFFLQFVAIVATFRYYTHCVHIISFVVYAPDACRFVCPSVCLFKKHGKYSCQVIKLIIVLKRHK